MGWQGVSMKKRTRLFLIAAVSVLVLGLGTGLLASYVGLQNFTIIGGNGPDELSYIPSDARMVAFADVRDFVNSELRQKLRQFEPTQDQRNKFETETGIDFERDVDRVIAAAWSAASETTQGPPLMLARGRFDEVRIEGLIREHGGTVEDYKGKRLVVVPGDSPDSSGLAVAFVEPGLVAAGNAAAVRKAIDTKQAGTGSVTGNAEVMQLIKDVDGGNAWAVARFDALSPRQLPKELAQQLPPINWFSASGRVGSGIEATIRAEAKDEKSAEDLREVIRGFMALARLQSGQKAEFAEIINSLELGGQGTTVTLGFTIPASVIDSVAALTAQRRRQPAEPQVVPDRSLPPPAVPSL
jgi:hypothetical protein